MFDPLVPEGGPVLEEKAITASCAEAVPADADIVVTRNVTSALGAGLIEAIPDQQIIDRATAELAENGTRAGHVHVVTGVSDGLPHAGRVGWKAQAALLIDVVGQPNSYTLALRGSPAVSGGGLWMVSATGWKYASRTGAPDGITGVNSSR